MPTFNYYPKMRGSDPKSSANMFLAGANLAQQKKLYELQKRQEDRLGAKEERDKADWEAENTPEAIEQKKRDAELKREGTLLDNEKKFAESTKSWVGSSQNKDDYAKKRASILERYKQSGATDLAKGMDTLLPDPESFESEEDFKEWQKRFTMSADKYQELLDGTPQEISYKTKDGDWITTEKMSKDEITAFLKENKDKMTEYHLGTVKPAKGSSSSDYTVQQKVDDTIAHYKTLMKAYLDPLTGLPKEETIDEYNSLIKEYKGDIQKASTGETPSWMEKQEEEKYKSADDVKSAFKSGDLSREEAENLLKEKFGYK